MEGLEEVGRSIREAVGRDELGNAGAFHESGCVEGRNAALEGQGRQRGDAAEGEGVDLLDVGGDGEIAETRVGKCACTDGGYRSVEIDAEELRVAHEQTGIDCSGAREDVETTSEAAAADSCHGAVCDCERGRCRRVVTKGGAASEGVACNDGGVGYKDSR